MSQYAHPEVLVTTQWLHDRLEDPNLRIIEVDTNLDVNKNAHIPNAIFWNIFTDILNPDLSINLNPDSVAKLLSRSGITPETVAIAYGSNPATGGWIFWLLKLFGHDRVVVLNGGYQKWMAENRPTITELSSFPATEYPSLSLNPDLRVLQPEIEESIDRTDRLLLDVRTPQEYNGEVYMMQPPAGEERGGHIPNAVHLEHSLTLNDDGTFKSIELLQDLFVSRGITADREIFPYCAIGGRSAYIWFVLKYLLGYSRVRNYDGSWNEWSRLPNLPIEC